MIEKTLHLFADYFQFYLQDETSERVPETWTDQALRDRVVVTGSAFAVSTARNMTVPVTVTVLNAAPDLDLSLWDHAVGFSIHVPSGRIVIAGCTDYVPDAERLMVAPGHYAARVLFANLGDLSEDGLEGADHYRIELWPGDETPLTLLKGYVE